MTRFNVLLLHVVLGLVIGTYLIVSHTSNTLVAHDYKNELDSETTDTAALLQVSLQMANNPASSERAHDGAGDHSRFFSGTLVDSQHGASSGLASNKGHEISKNTVTEYVAMAPSHCSFFSGSGELGWVKLEYPEGVSSANDVNITSMSESVAAIGSWYGLEIPGGMSMTGRVYGDNLYALRQSFPNKDDDPSCCSDRMGIYPRGDGGKYTEFPLDKVVQSAMGSTMAHATHSFDVTKLADGTLAALILVRYRQPALSNAKTDAIICINLADGSLIPTAAGKKNFTVYNEVGTTSLKGEQRFKIFFNSSEASSETELHHGNGVLRFKSSSGVTLLVFTHKYGQEVVVFKDPWTYTDGGQILQRFGTPSGHYFGLSSSASPFLFLHNAWYTPKSLALGGVESITAFINRQDGKSQAYEFALALQEEGGAGDPGDDTVFSTKYVHATCSFVSDFDGGARPIGNGVFLVASGGTFTGVKEAKFEVVDVSGNRKSIPYSPGSIPSEIDPCLYDPFIRVLA